MLIQCSIRNFAVIESVQIEFGHGFHVMTGETGAGKSIIVDALSLIGGGRGSAEWVRHGAAKAEIECLFELPPSHPVHEVLASIGIHTEDDEMLVIRREISSSGKSVCRINGQMVNLSMLRQVGHWLIQIHGQHEHQSLMNPSSHINLLDTYASDETRAIKEQYSKVYKQYQAQVKEFEEMTESMKDRLHKIDLYSFQTEEIASASLTEDEEERLQEERSKLSSADKLLTGAERAYDALYGQGGALERVSSAMDDLESIVKHDSESLTPLVSQIKEAYYQLEDISFALRDYKEQVEFNPQRLDEIEQRLDTITGLKRKYGDKIKDVLEYYDTISTELQQLQNMDERAEELEAQLQATKEKLYILADQLTQMRQKTAKVLSERIMGQLKELHMEKTVFSIEVRILDEIGANGINEVEFMIAPNPGEPLRPMHRIASGGELSRIMLALKTIFAQVESIPVLIFDEVDTGVSGRAAQAIAEKMARLSLACQTFAVTHLPQVACMADRHYVIHKEVKGERTYTLVEQMTGDQRSVELARMLGGVEVTSMTEEHAVEMLRLADDKKKAWRKFA